jgi:hypothetical protein
MHYGNLNVETGLATVTGNLLFSHQQPVLFTAGSFTPPICSTAFLLFLFVLEF